MSTSANGPVSGLENGQASRQWHRPPMLIPDARWRWGLGIGAAVYLVLALASVEVNIARITEGLERGWRFVEGFLSPDFVTRWRDMSKGLV